MGGVGVGVGDTPITPVDQGTQFSKFDLMCVAIWPRLIHKCYNGHKTMYGLQ
jgi:hypothetical protein